MSRADVKKSGCTRESTSHLRFASVAAARFSGGHPSCAVKLLAVAVLTAALLNGVAFGLGTEQFGPDAADRPTVAQPDWPKGIVALPQHPSRVYSWWVNGNEMFFFDATVPQINELLAAFGKARLRDHVIRIVNEGRPARSFKGQEFEYNVSLQIVAGIVLHTAREGESKDLPLEPQLTIVAGEHGGVLKELVWPENAIVECDIPGVTLASKRTRPQRQFYFGKLAFDDGSPPEQFVRNRSRITLWEKGSKDGIEVGTVDYQGYFRVPFSADELGRLWGGEAWLTVSIGNWLTPADPNDPRFPTSMLTVNKTVAEALKVSEPTYYWGRILFEDGSSPVLNPAPWPGAEIMVSFPYAGAANPDADGYFKVVFSEGQFEALKKQKVRKNIYLPLAERGRSRAMVAFPPSMLARERSAAGVVNIPMLNLVPGDCKPTYQSSGIKE